MLIESRGILVNFISKDANLVFYLSVYLLVYYSNMQLYDLINFSVDSTVAMPFIKCNAMLIVVK